MSTDYHSIASLLQDTRRRLSRAGVDSSGLDAEILIRTALGVTREELYMRLSEAISPGDRTKLDALLEKRLAGYPIAYITGRREFYGREFQVSPAVLVPRPETEYLVEWSLGWLKKNVPHRGKVVDVGTGSGAIAVSIAAETNSQHHVIATDVSREAAEVARVNRDTYHANVELVAGSLLDWWSGNVDLIAANLPYLRPDQAHEGIRFEPSVALFAGDDGFALNRALIQQAARRLARPGALIMEIDPGQADLASRTANAAFPDDDVRIESDLAGIERYLIVTRI